MWVKSYSKVLKEGQKKAVWNRWSDVNSWHEWDTDTDYCRLEKPFQKGSRFILKPKGASAVTVQLIDVQPEKTFTVYTQFFGAKMYFTHEMDETPDGLKVTFTLKVEGPLGFLWRMLVVGKIAGNLPILMKNLANSVGASSPKKEMLGNPPLQAVPPKKKLSSAPSPSKQAEPKLSPSKKKKTEIVDKGKPIQQDDVKPTGSQVRKGKPGKQKETVKKAATPKKASTPKKIKTTAQPKASSLKIREPESKKTKPSRNPKPQG